VLLVFVELPGPVQMIEGNAFFRIMLIGLSLSATLCDTGHQTGVTDQMLGGLKARDEPDGCNNGHRPVSDAETWDLHQVQGQGGTSID